MSATIKPIGCRASGTCGFTLVEVLVIVAILALMAGIVFPSVERALQRQSFVDSARQVEFGLRAARARAIENGATIRFLISKGGHRFAYDDRREQLPDSTTIVLPNGGITFFADGSASGGDITVTDGTYSQRLVIQSAVGLIERVR